ncbi:MAG TPA: DUF3857 domain-containing protein [Gammaproteobacteria bacterium]|nr:DUF3857 domain-containing protein [Gammaproteobacteria bacterium]
MNMRKTAFAFATALTAGIPVVQAVAATTPQVNYRIISHHVALDIAKDGSYTKTVSRVVQPTTLSGVEQVAQAQIAYPANFATLKILAAYTETAAHKRLNVAPSAIFTQSTATALRAPLLSQGTVKNLIFPAVTPGSTLHLKYVEHFDRAYLPGVYAASATLAPSVPAHSVTISITAPKSMPLYFHARGPWVEHRSAGHGTETLRATGSWSHVDFPPQDTAAVTQYAPMAVLSTAADWKAIARAYDALASESGKLTPAIDRAAAQAADGAHGKRAVARIYHWMQQHIQAVNVDYRDAGFRPPTPASTLGRGIGDSNASAALLCCMLRAAGIEAVPALISTSPRYVPYPGADPFAFDHVLVYVPAYHLYLDTSQRYAGMNASPLMDAGKPVLITGGVDALDRAPAPRRNRVQYREVQSMTLDSDGVISGTSQITASGWRAIDMRQNMLSDRTGDRLRRSIQNGYYRQGHTGSIQVAEISNRGDLNRSVSAKLQWRDSDAFIPGRRVALVLPTPGKISAALAPFVSQATNSYPTVLKRETVEEVVHVRLPAGMKLAYLPRSRHLETPFGSYSVRYHYAKGRLDEDRRLQLTRFVVEPQQYPELHRLAMMAVSTAREGLLLSPVQRG